MKSISLLLLSSVFFLFSAQIVFASDIVINEYLPNPEGSSETSEWIEIFNTTDSEIDLSGWKLDDIESGGSGVYTLPSGSIISGKGYFILERSVSGIILNNDSDKIRLLNSADQIIDEYNYLETEENIFYGRKIDGGSEWVEFSESTKGSSNNDGSIIPTATLTPEPTNEPTNTSVPSKTPTPVKSPTVTLIPTETKVPTKKISPTVKKSPTPRNPTPTKKSEKKVLAETSAINPTGSLKPTKVVQVKGSWGFNPGIISLSIGGILLIGCGILLFYMKKKGNVA